MKKTLKVLAAVAALSLPLSVQGTDTAYVSFRVNVDAAVTAQQGTETVQKNVTKDVTDTLKLPIAGSISVWYNGGAQGQLNAPIITGSRGNITLRLPTQSYQNAEVALHSINGRRVMRGKADASETANGVSRRNVAAGVYTLSVKGTNGNAFTTRLIHSGGNMNINVTFGTENASPARQLAKSVADGEWAITVSATGSNASNYKDSSYKLIPVKDYGTPLQNITLLPQDPSAEPMTAKNALQYFRDEGVKAGWNLGNTLDAVDTKTNIAEEGVWGTPAATQALINGVKAQGFDIVRIGCSWNGHIGAAPEYKISEARLQRVAQVVGWVRDAGMKAIINIHHDGNYTNPPNTWGFLKFAEVGRGEADNEQVKDQLGKVWTQIAGYFKDYGDFLIFETMNEVHSGNWGCSSGAACNVEQDRLFEWNQTALNAIRATGGNNTKRFVAVPGLGSTEPGTVIAAHNRGKLLPNDPGNGTNKLIVSIHFYAPWQYTVADVSATQVNDRLRHTLSAAELSNIGTEAGRIKTTFIDNGIAAYYGEWGGPTNTRSSMDQTIKDTHIDYIRRVAGAADANGILPIIWDDGGNFKMLERTGGSPGVPKAGLWADVLNAYMNAIE